MLMDKGRHLRDYYERAERQGKPLEITINNGVAPAITLAALSPGGAASMEGADARADVFFTSCIKKGVICAGRACFIPWPLEMRG